MENTSLPHPYGAEPTDIVPQTVETFEPYLYSWSVFKSGPVQAANQYFTEVERKENIKLKLTLNLWKNTNIQFAKSQ